VAKKRVKVKIAIQRPQQIPYAIISDGTTIVGPLLPGIWTFYYAPKEAPEIRELKISER
jgi:hypothetical protein